MRNERVAWVMVFGMVFLCIGCEHVTPKLPVAGVDTATVTMTVDFEIEGVGKDSVELEGVLISYRSDPLYAYGKNTISWRTSTVVSTFKEFNLEGESDLFGPIKITLDESKPSFGSVMNGDCSSAHEAIIHMPQIERMLYTGRGFQFHSRVSSVPPSVNDIARSVNTITLVDESGRTMGRLNNARMVWKEIGSEPSIGIVSE